MSKDEFLKFLDHTKILVITANPVEQGVLLRWLSQKNNAPLNTYLVDSVAYNVFNLGNDRCIIHVKQTKTGEEFTRKTINHASKTFFPSCICLVGICYGFDMTKHSIGTVFISDSITSFRINFRNEKDSDEVKFEIDEEYTDHPSKGSD